MNNLSDINKFDLADNSLIVTGKGVLKAASDKVFEADTSGKKVIAGVDQKVLFNGGKLAISDTSYTLADSKVYSEALGKVDDSGVGANTKTTIVMTGTLQDQPVDNKATVDDLAPTGAVHTNVTGTVSTGTLNVGDGVPLKARRVSIMTWASKTWISAVTAVLLMPASLSATIPG